MSQKVKLRRSAVPGNKPTTTQLDLGELAINTNDGKIYFEKSSSLGESIEEVIVTNTWNTGSVSVSGSVRVSGSFINNGLTYPLVDNGAKSFIQSDGAGNLTLQYVNTMYETVRNVETSSMPKGTPIYISGSTGANPNAYFGDAGNPNRMPVVYIAGEDLAPSQTGLAIVLGLIEGVNTSLYPPGTEVYVGVGGGWTATRPTGSAIVQSLGYVTKQGVGGQGVVLNPGPFNLPNLNSGSVWVGNSSSTPVAVSTSSLLVNNAISASYALNSTSASYSLNSTSASYALNSTSASYALNSTSASYAFNSTSASYAISSSYTLNATSASYSLNSTSASYSLNSTSASYALNATNALTASYVATASYIPTLQQVTTQGNSTSTPITSSGILSNGSVVTTSTNGFRLLSGNDTLFSLGYSGGTLLDRLTGTNFFIAENGSPQFAIIPGGNVGIGTNSPGSILDISAGTNLNLAVTQLALDNFSNEGIGITFSRTSSDADLMALGVVSTDKLGLFSREGIIFGTGGTSLYSQVSESMCITGTGNVGIGTTSPSYKLDVNGDINSGGTLYTNLFNFRSNDVKTNPATVGRFSTLTGGSSDFELTFTRSAIGAGAYYAIQSVEQNVGFRDLVLQPNGGSVGIGTTTPSTKLHINFAGQGLLVSNDSGNRRLYLGTDSSGEPSIQATLSNGTARQLNINPNGGNVGIGTTDPIGKLQIAGTSGNLLSVGTLTNNWGGNVAIGIENGNGIIVSKINTANDTNRVLVIARNDTEGATIYGYTPTGTSTSIGFLIRANANSYFNGGNVGIGTTSPGFKLDVTGISRTPRVYINRSNNTDAGIIWYDTSYPGWTQYMGPAGATSQGPNGNLTAPAGTLVTSWALRSYIENASGYGWTWESAAHPSTTPSVVAEIRSSDGAAKFGGGVTAPSFTGSLAGTASYSTQALSSSFATTASYALNAGSGVTINSNVNNYLVTATGTANTLNGESNLQYDGNGLFIGNAGSTPSAPANGTILYSEDIVSSSELKVIDEAGNITTLSPHNFSLIPEGPSEPLAWSYYSEKDGRKINVDMLKLARTLEKLTGEKLVYIE